MVIVVPLKHLERKLRTLENDKKIPEKTDQDL